MPIVSDRKGIFIPVKAFLISRVGLFVLAWILLSLFPAQRGKRFWHAFPHNPALDGWTRFDSGWYVRIAKYGYKNIPTGDGQDTNFFPLYPILVRIIGKVTKNAFLSGIIVSNIALLIALIGLFRLVSIRYGPELAARTVYLLSLNPFSFFFSAVYAEALFLLFLVYAFYFCEKGRYFLAGSSAALAGATRNLGIFALVGLILVAIQKEGKESFRSGTKVCWMCIGLVGPLLYIAFLWVRFGDPLTFVHAQHAWGSFNPGKLLRFIFRAFRYGTILTWGYPILFLFHALVGILAVVLVVRGRKFLGFPYTVFSLLMILSGFLRFTSLGRYVMVVFPVFIMLAKVSSRKWVYRGLLIGESCLLILFTYMFSHWYWVA